MSFAAKVPANMIQLTCSRAGFSSKIDQIFPADSTISISALHFPADPKILRKQLPTELLISWNPQSLANP